MTSFIIVAPNSELQEEKLSEFCTRFKIDPLDRVYITPDKETSLGIEVIKKLQEKIFLKPFKGKEKAIIIPQAELLTIPAQNALLKLLEEPPAHTFIFLLSSTQEVFLPTIISRCQLIDIKTILQQFTDDEKKKVQLQFKNWIQQSPGDALKQAEIIAKDKDKALQTLEKFIVVGESILKDNIENQKDPFEVAYTLKKLHKTYATLKATNTNARLTLENLFLSLSTIH